MIDSYTVLALFFRNNPVETVLEKAKDLPLFKKCWDDPSFKEKIDRAIFLNMNPIKCGQFDIELCIYLIGLYHSKSKDLAPLLVDIMHKFDGIYANTIAVHLLKFPPSHSTYQYGDIVKKKSGAQWTGVVVGWYCSSLTGEGYAIESVHERGSVQIYPVKALEYA